MFAKITKSTIDGQKLTAIFYDKDKMPIQTIHLGASGDENYTIAPHDEHQKARYIKRHKAAENWNHYTTTGALSK